MLGWVYASTADRLHSQGNQGQKVLLYYRCSQSDITREHRNINKEVVNSHKECFNKMLQYVCHTLIKNGQFSTFSKQRALYDWEDL